MRTAFSTTILAVFLILTADVGLADGSTSDLREDERGTFSFVWENDSIADRDKNYTNGIRVAWLSATRASDGLSAFMANRILNVDSEAYVRRGFALGHSIFTPNDIEIADPLPDQHPYAGWLYGEYSILVQQRDRIDRLGIQAGIVGPSAGGEWLQNEVHSLIGTTEAQGWENQIRDEAGIVISYDRKLRTLARFGGSGLGADVTPNFGLSLGNVYTNARAGLTLRIGEDLRNDFGPPRVRPSLAGAGYFTPRDRMSWYLFAGVEGRAVAHNIFLDGSLFRDGDPSVSSKTFVVDYQAGAVLQVGGLQFALTLVERSDEFEEQVTPQRFGALSIGVKF